MYLFQLQDAVTTAHETSDAFSDETLREQTIFQYSKEAEMKEMLGNVADGQIEFYKAVCGPLSIENIIKLLILWFTGDGRMGKNHTRNTTYTRGRLVTSGLFFCYFPQLLYFLIHHCYRQLLGHFSLFSLPALVLIFFRQIPGLREKAGKGHQNAAEE